ncbi:hypothetical protein ATCC90586_010448 [Pythium insidiosum]|nr:hypothetical protein ATCC90586_010448 [Pythium insidiosum]
MRDDPHDEEDISSGSESASDSDAASGSDGEPDSTKADTPQDAQDLLKLLTQVFAVSNAQGKKQREHVPSTKPRQETQCTHCGSTRHQDRDCWRRLTCETCGRKGHPSEHCYQLCKGCGKLHEKGACPLEEIANGLRAWYDPAKHAGILPPKIEKWLN